MPEPCGHGAPAFYRRRTPRESPLFQLLEQHFDEFERVYPDRYQECYGFFRPVIGKAVNAFLGCGDLLKHLPRLAWETVRDIYRAVLDRNDVVPGMVGAPQTFGDLINWHPHVHALTADGAFTKDGTFLPMPNDLTAEPFLKVWEHKIFAHLLAEGRITEKVVEQMRSWRHSGTHSGSWCANRALLRLVLE